MGHSILPTVHAHLDSHKRPSDGFSKFWIRVDIGGAKRLYPTSTKGDRELYMDRAFWVNEKDPETGRKLKNKRISHSKGNRDSKRIERILNSKIKEMDDLIEKLAKTEMAITHDLLQRLWGRKDAQTFSAYAKAWYEDFADSRGHKPKSRKSFETLLKAITQFEEFAGPVRLPQISVDWLRQFQNWLFREEGKDENGKVTGKGYSDSTAGRAMRRVGTILRYAHLEGEISRNVFDEFSMRGFYSREEACIGSFLEKDELQRLQEAYANRELEVLVPQTKGRVSNFGTVLHERLAIILFGVYSGLRFSDLQKVANRHPDVSFGKTHLSVTTEKTGAPVRLYITERLREVANLGQEGSVFKVKMGNNANLNNNLRKICSLLGITKHVSIHSLRRTFATYLLNEGVRMKIVSTLAGHSSVLTTERHYAKVADNSLDEAMKMFDVEQPLIQPSEVNPFLQDVAELIQANPGLKIPERLRLQMERLKPDSFPEKRVLEVPAKGKGHFKVA
ncbi:MAG: tyrosine-type recombinase/integrase [Bacteroidia bacterium]|nr:tyrosine-type recombinase/integrase [Bacteroidia bacterium]